MSLLASSQSEISDFRVHHSQDAGDDAATGPRSPPGCLDDPAAGRSSFVSPWTAARESLRHSLILASAVHCFLPLDGRRTDRLTEACSPRLSPLSNKNCTTVAWPICRATKKMHKSIHTSIFW